MANVIASTERRSNRQTVRESGGFMVSGTGLMVQRCDFATAIKCGFPTASGIEQTDHQSCTRISAKSGGWMAIGLRKVHGANLIVLLRRGSLASAG